MDGRRLTVVLVVLLLGSRPAVAQVRAGIDVLLADSFHLVSGRRVGLLTNQTGVNRSGRSDLDRLRAAGVAVTALYSPEHGFWGDRDRPRIADTVDQASGLPIYSLYGGTRPPLDSVDAVLVDLQDVGARYYTYAATAARLMAQAAGAHVPIIVLDRPNPLGGVLVQGNVQARPAPDALVGMLPVAMRHGMTIGELLRMANDALALHATLRVVPAAGWRRDMLADETGLPWVAPSPALPSLESVRHYPGLCLFEGTNVSVGRGTRLSYQVLGAPWLDADAVRARVGRVAMQGVALSVDTVTPEAPADGKYPGLPLQVLRFRVTNVARYDPTHAAVVVLAALVAMYPDSFRFHAPDFDRLAGGAALRVALLRHEPPSEIWGDWDRALVRFRRTRLKYLLY
jgi:uncharacterized protein YbbC (DUF1343 family)